FVVFRNRSRMNLPAGSRSRLPEVIEVITPVTPDEGRGLGDPRFNVTPRLGRQAFQFLFEGRQAFNCCRRHKPSPNLFPSFYLAGLSSLLLQRSGGMRRMDDGRNRLCLPPVSCDLGRWAATSFAPSASPTRPAPRSRRRSR